MSKASKITILVLGIVGLGAAGGVFVHLHRELAKEAPLPGNLPTPEKPDTSEGERMLERVKEFSRLRAALREESACSR